jgi:threonine/homoserine/homoserine lactone efflux protein
MTEMILVFILALLTAVLGALPFGLVNMSVLETSLRSGRKPAMSIACGASVIEVIYGLAAITGGGMLNSYIEGNALVGITAILVLTGGGIYYFFKKPGRIEQTRKGGSYVFRGLILNLASIQVFLFWLLAVAFLAARGLLQYDGPAILVFLLGIWTGKMLTLVGYMQFGEKMLARSGLISGNINRIIGMVLIGMALIQIVKM